ncbi:brain-specific angiogenesis inhibitor 1-associated protein 2-like [Schistocerca serialis cubense]|uniref:brain-specific angiogenesis inhibitor 1-associated protein 2-like n=1 Tax=Schistocerca serialis cubense TaxID=2023355 RepID=UPI00214E1975|nr:brain-specific angiogenesis inhibitor 1-associated protein 2-like [Schistocerca serialis cubense]
MTSTMDLEEITKLVDGIYKNILDKFNPGARQLITAGKAYLKALHGAAAASRLYVDAISKLAKQAQQGTWGASADIGSALIQIVDVYKEIHEQQMNILKAFYVDMLVPLETNLEKDTKVVQSEQKRFLQQHKQRSETYSKAAAAIKKQRKKTRAKPPAVALDREVKSLQALEEERAKLDAFCEASLKTAMTQERRRYGFVLERQCSLAKHYLLHHSQCRQALEGRLDAWQEVAQSREALPDGVEAVMAARLRQVNFYSEDAPSEAERDRTEDDRVSMSSQLRKTKSMDASCLDMRSIGDAASQHSPLKPLSRAKSEFDLSASTQSLDQVSARYDRRDVTASSPEPEPRPKSLAVASENGDAPLARAMYAYLSSGDNQLSFLEGDVIALMGERIKGWQFGENLRTQTNGWFPLAYTEMLLDAADSSSPTHSTAPATPASPTRGLQGGRRPGAAHHQPQPQHAAPAAPSHRPATRQGTRGAVATAISRALQQQAAGGAAPVPGGRPVVGPPPPLVPAPVPRRLPPAAASTAAAAAALKAAGASLHSSNDSGFSNEPPPLPEADYSDDDSSSEKTVTAVNAPVSSTLPTKQRGSGGRGWSTTTNGTHAQQAATNGHTSGGGGGSGGRKPTTEPRRREYTNGLVNGTSVGGSPGASATTPRLPHLSTTLGRDSPPRKPSYPVKRTKSLWKFRRSEQPGDILEGMSLWRHRSLVDVPAALDAEAKRENGHQEQQQHKKPAGRQQKAEAEERPAVAVQTEDEDLDSMAPSEVDEEEDSESCIVVEDHRRPPPQQPAPVPRQLRGPQQQQLQQQQLQQQQQQQQQLHSQQPHKRMSGASQGSAGMTLPWYKLWGMDVAAVK